MPIPQRKPNEKKETYMERCMGNSNMQEYDQKQRYAICLSEFNKKKTKSEEREEAILKGIKDAKKQ